MGVRKIQTLRFSMHTTCLQDHFDFLFQFSEIERLHHIRIGGNGFHILLKGIMSGGENHRQVVKSVTDTAVRLRK